MKFEPMNTLITKIYDAAIDPELWEDFMLASSNVLKGTTGFLAMFDLNQPDTNILKTTRFDPDTFDYYMKHYSQERDVWYQLVRQNCGTGSVFVGSELIADKELRKTPMFHEILKPLEGGYLLGCVLDGSETLAAAYTLSRPMKGNDFSKRDKQIMTLLTPHLQRAYQLHRKYIVCQQAKRSAEEALHSSPTAIILLNASGQVVFISRRAEDMVNLEDGLRCTRGTLHFDAPRHTQTFEALLTQSSLTSQQHGFHPGGGFRVERPSGRAAYQLMVMPLNYHSDHHQLSPHAAVCVLLHDPDLPEALSVDMLCALYALTLSEAKVAQLFGAGKTPADISAIQGIKMPTVRTHLRHIYEKTGATTQSELMWMFIRGPGSVM